MPTTRKTEGIFVRANRKFYYLETGNITPRSSLDRVRSLLIQRDLISYHREDAMDREPSHKTMTLGEAEDAGLEIERIFLNKHIEAQWEDKLKVVEQPNPWKR